MKRPTTSPVTIELNAVLVALTANEPQVLTLEDGALLPSGPFESEHPTLQSGLRGWVERQTHHPLGYVEQLYTFANRDRTRADNGQRVISISYLGLTREQSPDADGEARWRSWYGYFPWEDRRAGVPGVIGAVLLPRLQRWADAGAAALRAERRARVAISFGL